MGAKLWYLSCPVVSQVSNFTVASFIASAYEKNAAPIVDSCHHKRQHKVKNSATQSPRFHKFKTHQAQNNSSHKSKPKTINTQLQTEEKYHLLHHTPLFRHHSKLHSYNNQHSLITTIIASMIKSGCDQPEFLTFSIIVFNKNSFETTKPHYWSANFTAESA